MRLGSGQGTADAVEAQLFPGIRSNVNPGAMGQTTASGHVRSKLGNLGARARIQILGERVRWLRGRWRIVHEFHVADIGARAAVDEESGETALWDSRTYQTYSGNVSGRLVLFSPQTTTTLDTAPLKEIKVTDGASATTFTDLSGNYTLTTPASGDLKQSL